MDYQEYFDIDKLVAIKVDNSPRTKPRCWSKPRVHHRDNYLGATMRNWRHAGGT